MSCRENTRILNCMHFEQKTKDTECRSTAGWMFDHCIGNVILRQRQAGARVTDSMRAPCRRCGESMMKGCSICTILSGLRYWRTHAQTVNREWHNSILQCSFLKKKRSFSAADIPTCTEFVGLHLWTDTNYIRVNRRQRATFIAPLGCSCRTYFEQRFGEVESSGCD